MTMIRPIFPTFRSTTRQQKQDSGNAGQAKTELVSIAQKKRPGRHDFQTSVAAHSTVLAAQLLAQPVRRGIRASESEKNRFFAAYQSASTNTGSRQQKWA
jgi:hypothetical protein